MKKWIKRTWWIPIVLLLAAGGFLYWRNTQLQQMQTAVLIVKTVKLSKGSITTSISATGSVRASQNVSVTWSLSGQVGKILVQVGEQVSAGQLLAALDSSNLPGSVVKAQADLISAQKALDDLKTSKVDLAKAQQDLVTAQNALTTAKQKRAYLNSSTHGDAGSIQAAQAAYQLAQNEVDRIQDFYNKRASLPDDDPGKMGAEITLEAAKKNRNEALAEYTYEKSKPTAEEISVADAALALAQAKVDDALRAYNRQKGGPTAEEIAAAGNNVKAAQQVIDSLNLTAPIDGTVTNLKSYAGKTVAQGEMALRIDNLAEIYVDLLVSEVDINSVQVGQDVTLTFDAIADKTYNGKVTEVGLIGASSSGVVNYTVTVQIGDADQQVRTGMTAAATLITSSLNDILLAPSASVKTVNKQASVYVLRGGQPQPVAVTIGAASDTMTQIVSGDVTEADMIVANPSTATTTASSTSMSFLNLFGLLGGGGSPAMGPGAGGPPAGGGPGGPPAGGGPGGPPGGGS